MDDWLDQHIKVQIAQNKMIAYLSLFTHEKEERKIICNGCGPKGLFIPIPNFVFKEACDHHDFNYWIGCNKAQRKKADKQFLTEMLYEANGNLWYKIWAYTYYRAVRIGGIKCFHWDDVQRTKKDLKEFIIAQALENCARKKALGVMT